jgi:predicted secreted protein
VQAVIEEVAPNQSEHLWQSVVESMSSDKQEDDNIDQVLMIALTECYNNANSWETRCEILSIMADKVTFSTLKK